jgi:hypothetical protein
MEVVRISHTLVASGHSSEDVTILADKNQGLEIRRIKVLYYNDPAAETALFGLMKQSGKVLDSAAHALVDALYLKLIGGGEEAKEEFEKGELIIVGDLHISVENYAATTPDIIIEIHYEPVALSREQLEAALDLLSI